MKTDVIGSDPAFAKAKKDTHKIAIAFYNVENLFDTKDDPKSLDDDFTPTGKKKWTALKYQKKIKKIAKVISKIGATSTNTAPSLVGLAEIENAVVLKDLIASKSLAKHEYGFVHRESPDERGIDVALLYKKNDFTVSQTKSIEVYLETRPGVQDKTRDILHVQGILKNTEIHLLINHWPSKRSGAKETAHKRIEAAKSNRAVITTILKKDPEARILIMGDFNDGPNDISVRDYLVKTDFYNPMVFLGTRYEGSLNHRWRWYMYDQIIFSNNFMRLYNNPLTYSTSNIFNASFLANEKGKFKTFPFRTFAGDNYIGGYSDHFPVYSILKTKES